MSPTYAARRLKPGSKGTHTTRAFLALSVTVAMLLAASPSGSAEADARVPLVSDTDAAPAAADIFQAIRASGASPLDMHRAVANAPELFAAYVGMARALRKDDHVSRQLRELAILRTLQLEEGGYEIQQHTRMARSCGVSEAQIAALGDWRASKLFAPEQRAILGWVEGMATPAGPDAASAEAMKRSFDPHAIVEITLTTGFYSMSARVTKALDVKSEPPAPIASGYGAC